MKDQVKWSGIGIAYTLVIMLVCKFIISSYSSREPASNHNVIPDGAIVAFAGDGCPEGWEVYNRAAGRFIMGAGNLNFDFLKIDDIRLLPAAETLGFANTDLRVSARIEADRRITSLLFCMYNPENLP